MLSSLSALVRPGARVQNNCCQSSRRRPLLDESVRRTRMASVVCSCESGGPEALRACANRAANAAPLRCDSTRLVVCEYPRHTRGAGGTRKARRHVAETHLSHVERGARSRLGAVDGSRGRAAAAARLLEVCCASVATGTEMENDRHLSHVGGSCERFCVLAARQEPTVREGEREREREHARVRDLCWRQKCVHVCLHS